MVTIQGRGVPQKDYSIPFLRSGGVPSNDYNGLHRGRGSAKKTKSDYVILEQPLTQELWVHS